jgi:hypothetical protein
MNSVGEGTIIAFNDSQDENTVPSIRPIPESEGNGTPYGYNTGKYSLLDEFEPTTDE